MRLIDADNFSNVIKDYFIEMVTKHKYNVDCVDCNADLQRALDNQPTDYDVEKVVEQLEEKAKHYNTKAEEYATKGLARELRQESEKGYCYECAIDIVKQGGVEIDE